MKMRFNILLTWLCLCIGTSSYSQNCPFDNTFWSDMTPAAAGASVNDACIFGGDLITVSVTVGETYVFSTCPTVGVDVTMTLYNTAGTVILATDDDGCGPVGGPSIITWVATFTGVANLLVDEFPCVTGMSCIDLTVTWVAPAGPCNADAGTYQAFLNGALTTGPILMCKGDCADIFTDSNFVLPPAVPGEQAEVMYALYTAAPNLAVEPNVDPNFSGLFWTGDDFSDCNDPTSILLGAGVGNDIWLVPITMDDGDNNGNPNAAINYDNNLDSCWAMGTPINLVYLDSITGTGTQNCATPSAVITLAGGFPGYNPGASYTVTNIGPGTMVQSGGQGQTLSFTGYTPGQVLSVTITNDGNGCSQTVNYTTPTCGGCAADAGTQTITINGVAATSPLVLCKGDCFDILTDSNFILPPAVAGEAAELMYGVYIGPPNLAVEPDLDPNYTGSLWTGDDFSDCNDPTSILVGAGLPQQVWLVPITMDDGDDNANPNGLIHYDNDGDACFDLGTPIEIVYLDSIVASITETCDQVTVTLSGGMPSFNGTGSYTVVNNGLGTMVQSGTFGETLTFTVYNPGDTLMYNVSNDGNGCQTDLTHITISRPTIILDSITDASCNGATDGAVDVTIQGDTLGCTYTLDMFDSFGDGWNGGFLDILVNGVSIGNFAAAGFGSSANIFVPHNGSIQLVYTSGAFENENSYNFSLGATLLFSDGINPTVGPVYSTTCVGAAVVYTYAWSNSAATPDIGGLAANAYTLTVTDPNGCTVSSGPHVVNEPAVLTAVVDSFNNATCNGLGAAFVSTTGGTTAYSFNWSNGDTDEDITGLAANTYMLTVTDNNSCTATTSVVISSPTAVSVTASVSSSYNGAEISCNGAADGEATAAGSGGTPAYSYLWNNGQTNAIATGLIAGSYTVTVTDSDGCTAIDNVTLNNPTGITLTVDSTTDVNCGGSNGAVYITATGGTGAYSYLWSNAEVTEDITGLSVNSYTVTVTDANGCTATNSGIVSNLAAGTIGFTVTNPTCVGNDGCIYANVTGTTGNIGYMWSTGATTDSICGLASGNYTLTVTDTIGTPIPLLDTVYFETFQGVHNWNLSASTGASGATPNIWEVNDTEGGVPPPGCGVANNGDQTLHITCTSLFCGSFITGAVYNATQLSNTRAESPIFSTVGYNNIALTFDYISNGEGLNDNASLWYNDGGGWQVLDPSLKTPLCGAQGQWTGYSVTLPASCDNNPTVQVGFNWTNNADNIGTDPSIAVNNVLLTSMGSGTGGSICTIINDTTLTGPTSAVTGIITIDTVVACANGRSGDVHVVASGGTPSTTGTQGTGYTYTWDPNAFAVVSTDTSVLNYDAGVHCVTITDSLGCTGVVCVTLTEPSAVTASLVSSATVSCNGDSTGSITVSGAGGQGAPYTYQWSANAGGQTAATATGLAGGATYSVTVLDAYFCTDSVLNVTIAQPTALTIIEDSTQNPSCNGTTDGAIFVSVSGGTPTYTFLWSNGATTEDLTGIASGGYTVTITDANGCTTTLTSNIAQPSAVSVAVDSSMSVSCNGLVDGAVYVTGASGTLPYTFVWSNGASTEDITGLVANTYTVTISDGNGCTDTVSVVITEPNVLDASILNTIHNGCVGDSTGAIDLQVAGGTAPFMYNWSNGATSEDVQTLPAGIYCVTVTDTMGCMDVICDTITEPFFNIPQDTFYICPGDSVQIAVNTNATSISWTPAATLNNDTIANPFASPSSTTTYVVSATTGTNGNLVVNGDFEAGNVGFTTTYGYGGGASGSYVIDTNANIYNGLHSGFDHTTGSGNFMIVDAAPGTTNLWCQTVNVVPNTNYDFSAWINNIIVPTSNFTDPTIEMLINGAVVQNTGAIPENPDVWLNYMASWNSGANTTATLCIRAVAAAGGGHDFGVDDISFVGASCVMMDSVVVIVDSLDVNLTATTDVLCNGDSTGTVTTMVTGGGAVNYMWNTGDTTANLANLGAGTYMLTATSGACADTLNVTINEPATALSVSLLSTVDATCNGGSDGEVTVGASGGTAGYTYLWSNAATTASITGIGAGTYIVTATDANGCTTILTNSIGEPTAILVQVFEVPVSCDSISDGSATLTASGGTPGFTYQWDPQAGNQITAMATGLASNTYSATVTDNVGCTYIVNGIFIGASLPVDSNDVPLEVTTGVLDCDLNAIGAMGINTANNYSYQWSNGETTQNITGLSAGTYSVTVTNGLGCTYVQTNQVTSPFVPNVNPWITNVGVVSTTVIDGTIVDIDGGNDQTALGVSYIWTSPSTDVSFGNPNDHSTTITSNTGGTYVLTITATASDTSACIDTGTVVLNVENLFSGIPNAFSPNGDGTNELFFPVGLDSDDIIRFRVFNRWGQEVYNGDALENGGWDGRFMGVAQPSEVYLYLLEYRVGTEPVLIKGEVTLMR